MKIAVGGKGGSGKTTVAGTLARVLADRGLKVVAVDDDSNPNLALTVGLPASAATGLPALPRDFLEERADAQGNKWLELAVPVEDFIDRFGVPAGENLTLLGGRSNVARRAGVPCLRVRRPRSRLAGCGSGRAEVRFVMARLLKATTAVLVVITTMAAPSVDAQLPVPMPNYPVPAYPVPGAIRDPGHRVVPPPESVDLARCLQSVPPPGTSPSEQAAQCRRSFGGPGGQGEEPPPSGSSDRSSQPLSPVVPDASSTEARARRMRALEAFPGARKTLVETLRPILAGLDEAADAERARDVIDAFRSRYSFLRDESSVRPTADTLQKLQDALRDFERASRIEQESEQQVASLVRQQRLSTETRDPHADPRVIAANLKASAEQRDASARERAALSAAIRRLGDQLDAR